MDTPTLRHVAEELRQNLLTFRTDLITKFEQIFTNIIYQSVTAEGWGLRAQLFDLTRDDTEVIDTIVRGLRCLLVSRAAPHYRCSQLKT